MAPVRDPRGINITAIEDGDLLRYDATPGQFVRLTPPDAPVVPAAIAGGESPTEAEFNALRQALDDLVTDLTAAGLLKAP